MKNGSCSATTVAGSAALPFVLSTGGVMGLRPTQGDESGSCSATTVAGSAARPFVISTGEVMGQRPTQGDEKRVLFSNYCCWKRRPPLCHLDRRSHGPKAHPRRRKTGPVQQLLLLEAPPSPLSSRPEKS